MIDLDFQPLSEPPGVFGAKFRFGGFDYIIVLYPRGCSSVVVHHAPPAMVLFDDPGDGTPHISNIIAVKTGGEADALEARCWLYGQMGLE